ncbi:DUF1127 domain-containing protein [Roseomonas gilardii]|uniref:DUF1127 domain-containing protein n=1 Tax=Roseomonas gilardii TaxID=257708 RepID=UPI0004BCF3E9|nr:DUF1127 domain-containing protein [Roseomonas gilardii]SUE43939.1 Uncharacterized conserved small protein [Roseomonas gilardii subsp. rosea]
MSAHLAPNSFATGARAAAARGRGFAQTGTRPGAVRQFLDVLARIHHAIESRRQLAEMDDRMLSDIGISRGEALTEAARPAWDMESHRRG